MSRSAWMLSGLLLACMAPAWAGVPRTPSFRMLGVADGLPSGSINALAQDRAGYLWIATADGLARYDGLGFRTWRHDPADPGSLPGNNVQALLVDARDRVWVATEAGGLSVLDPARRRFGHYRKATHPSIGSDDTWAIASRDGETWFGTWGGGLHRMQGDGRVTRFMPRAGDPHSLPAANVVALAFDDGGQLWIGTTSGLARWNGRGLERIPIPGDGEAVVYALCADGDALWVATGGGLHRMRGGHWDDPGWTRRFARPNAALAMARDHQGEWWIGSQSGLWRVDPADRPEQAMPTRMATDASEPAAVGAVLVDRDGGLWRALPGLGLGYLRPRWRHLAEFPPPGSASPVHYRAVAAAQAGGVWLAERDGAPSRLYGDGRLHRLPARARDRLRRERIRALLESRDDVLWAGTQERLWRIARDGRVASWHTSARRDPVPGGIDLIRPAPDGSLWLSSAGVGVQQRDANGRVLRDWRAGSHGLGSADIEAMAVAADGSVWIAGDGGVARLLPHADAFARVPAMGAARVYALAFDGDTLWLSRPTGLEHYRRSGATWSRVARVGNAAGIPAVEAAGLVVDAWHRPWLATSRGLFRWDPRRRRLRRFGVEHGLGSQEFVARGLALARDGALAGITRRGVVVLFDTRAREPRRHAGSLQIAEVATREAGQWREQSPTALFLPADARELRVRMRWLAFADPAGIRYETRLEGDGRGWLPQPRGEQVVAGLRSGDYALRMRAIDVEGRSSGERVLRWRVALPWWRSPAAMAAWMLAVVLAATLVTWALRARWQVQRRLQRLDGARALAEEASRAKSRFLADLGHEVRTPMTGVLGMSELLLDGPLAPRQRQRVEAIRGAGMHLLQLVDEALDLARIEAGKLRLSAQAFALRPLVAEVVALQAPLARERGLRFVGGVDPGLAQAWVGDAMRIKQVLHNLLGNAIKFTENGEVGLQVGALEGGGLRVTVHDTGPGLESSRHPRLFRRFEQGDACAVEARHAGCGLGLAISQELVVAMGGQINAFGVPGKGTRFVVELPLETAARLPVSARLPRAPLPPAQPRAPDPCPATSRGPG